jgi:hypothetical protein
MKYGIYRPTAQSVISNQYKTDEYQDITTDIEGKTRPQQRMIGAFELSGNSTLALPTPETVGCSFINKTQTDIPVQSVEKQNRLITNLYFSNSSLLVESLAPALTLRIFDLKGKLLTVAIGSKTTHTYHFEIPDVLHGLYLFSFANAHFSEIKKIILN